MSAFESHIECVEPERFQLAKLIVGFGENGAAVGVEVDAGQPRKNFG